MHRRYEFAVTDCLRDGENTISLRGFSVAQMVTAADQKTLPGQKAAEAVIAAGIVAQPVDDLNHRPRGAVRDPLCNVNLMNSVGRWEIEGICFSHRNVPAFVLY